LRVDTPPVRPLWSLKKRGAKMPYQLPLLQKCLKHYMLDNHLSLAALSRETGISSQRLRAVLDGSNDNIGIRYISVFAKLFGMNLAEFVDWVG
jgi:hypothetical protein